MPSFHKPVDSNDGEIRVLDLKPASNYEDGLRCDLRTVSLSNHPEYLALSYVWGEEDVRECIQVNEMPFQATANLAAALRRMRYQDSPITLWIDAICINQDDNDEKSSQILLMKDIYQCATIVIIWLGEQDNDSYKAMQTLYATTEIGRNASMQNDAKQEMVLYGLQQDGALGALGRFFLRPWWTRVWVIQEAAFARKAMFLCGGKPLDWNCFLGSYFLWTEILQSAVQSNQMSPTLQSLKRIMDGTSARVIMWQYIRMHALVSQPELESGYGLQGMLEESWNFDSTDPRDKIYAWLCLQDSADITIEPNYAATPTHVYASLVKIFLERDQSLRLVAFTGSAVREARPLLEDLPTWAPDLRKGARGPPEHAPYWLRPKSYKASADDPANATMSYDLKTLASDCLRIGRLDSVEMCTRVMKVENVEDTLSYLLYFALGRPSTNTSTTGSLQDNLFRTLVYYWNDRHLGLSSEGHRAQQLHMQQMMLGFMAYIGYIDRMQDHLEERRVRAAQDTKVYLFHTIERHDPSTGQTSKIPVFGSAIDALPRMIRPASLSSRMTRVDSNNSVVAEQALSKPALIDFENFVRFFRLFGIHMIEPSEQDKFVSVLRDFLSEHNIAWTYDMQDWPQSGNSLATMLTTLLNRMQRFITRFATVVQHKTFFHTDSGYIGSGLKPTRVGDFVCIIRGCTVPLIVRARYEDDCFEVVGQCYVWGAMYGEAIATMHERNQKWERITFV